MIMLPDIKSLAILSRIWRYDNVMWYGADMPRQMGMRKSLCLPGFGWRRDMGNQVACVMFCQSAGSLPRVPH
jgi:hypothetical protein